jgi:hypothetical protein
MNQEWPGKSGNPANLGGRQKCRLRPRGENMIIRNAWTFVALISLWLAADRCRSQDRDTVPKPVVPEGVADAADKTQPALGARCLTLQQRLQEWGKVQPANETIAAAVEQTSPTPSPDHDPQTPAAPVVAPILPATAPCLAGPGHRCFRQQLIDWLTYRPLSRNVCDCFPKCVPCCEPRLYLFFLGPCCVNSAEAGNHVACARNGPCGCGERCTVAREPQCRCRSWTGLGSFHLWHGWDDLLFNHPKDCAHTASAADESLVDMTSR